MEFYAPMFLMTGILMLATMGVTHLPEATWWARRQRARIRQTRYSED